MHSVVRIMEEQPDLKFNCSAAALYRYADHAPFVQKFDDGWMDFGVNYRSFWIAEYNQVPLSVLPKYSNARLNNGEVREITAHTAGDQTGKYEFFRLELPENQVVVQELRRNRDRNRDHSSKLRRSHLSEPPRTRRSCSSGIFTPDIPVETER